MIRPPPRSQRTDTPLPYTTLCRSGAGILQLANGNTIPSNQSGTSSSSFSGVVQTGDGNAAGVTQNGTDDLSIVFQDGNLNTADVIQNAGDFSSVNQLGEGHSATVTQDGGATSEVAQSNEASGAPGNSATGSQDGSSFSSVAQLAQGNSAGRSQERRVGKEGVGTVRSRGSP